MHLFSSLLVVFFLTLPVFGARHAFIVQDIDTHQFLVQEGDVSDAFSPYCTFNLALSLLGFETHILQDAYNPEWPFREEYREEVLSWNDAFPEKWAVAHHPKTWMKNSCIWFSQALAQQLGRDVLADYVTIFDYGNKNLMGDEGKGNGLTHAWIGSSLRISPLEQVRFINRLLNHALFVSDRATELTREILFVEELPNGMALYGKTGAGNHGKGQETEYKVGWFVGWVEKESRRFAVAFVLHGDGADYSAKEQLKQRLLHLNIDEE